MRTACVEGQPVAMLPESRTCAVTICKYLHERFGTVWSIRLTGMRCIEIRFEANIRQQVM